MRSRWLALAPLVVPAALAGLQPAALAAQQPPALPARSLATDSAPPAIVTLAIARRQVETDSSLRAWRARARGVVTFLAEYGTGPSMTTRLVKADELDVDVYWEGRGRSRQVIRAWRDTTFLPTGMGYHRDHLAIVTDDFGPVIRVGEGDEVADAIHPLAPAGPAHYTYAVRDTTTVRTSTGVLEVVAVDVRPRRLDQPLVVGTMYLDLARAILVRSRFTFTPAAYRDPDLEDITIRLERTLVDDRAWLPYRQEIEVRRRSAVAAFPLRGVIRGEWVIGDFELDAAMPAEARRGPAIGGLRRPGGPDLWAAPLATAIDSGLRPADRRDVEQVRRDAARLVGGRLLDGLPDFRPGVDRLSEILRVNRIEGLVLGGGFRWQPRGHLPALDGRLAVGTADGRVTGSLALGWRTGGGTLAVTGRRGVVDVSDVPVASGVFGSLSAQETGHDYGDYVLAEGVGLAWRGDLVGAAGVSLELGREWAWSVRNAASPARGAYRPNPPLGSEAYWVARGQLGRVEDHRGRRGWSGRVALEAGVGRENGYARALLEAADERPLGPGILGLRGWLGLGTAALPARRSFPLGGRGTLLGTPYRAWGGRQAAWLGAEWLGPLPAPSLPLGWLGRTAPQVWLGPVVRVGWAGGAVEAPWQPSRGPEVVVGGALELFDRLVRLEVARSVRTNSGLGFAIDVTRPWWPIL